MILLFLLLWFIKIGMPQAPEVETVEIEFADESIEAAGGFATPAPSPITEPQPHVTVPAPTPVEAKPDPVITQEAEEALAMQKQREEEERKQREEQMRLEQLRLEQERLAAERAAAEKAAADKANALMGAFKGNGGGGTGGQTTSGSGGGDNPLKNGIVGGNGWSAKGRTLQGSIPKPEIKDYPEGKVVVSFRINAQGKVSNPQIAKGTTISDANVQKACKNAVLKAQFSPGIDEVEGTITYNLKVN